MWGLLGGKHVSVCGVGFRGPVRVRFVKVNKVDVDNLTRVLLRRKFAMSNSSSGRSPLAGGLRSRNTVVRCKRYTRGVSSKVSYIMCATTVGGTGPRLVRTITHGVPVLAHTRLLKRLVGGCGAPVTMSNARKGAAAASVVSRVLLTTSLSPAVSINNVLGTVNNGVHIKGSRAFVARTYRCAGDFLRFCPGVDIVLGVRRSRLSFFGSLRSVERSFRRFTTLLPSSKALVVGNSVSGCRRVCRNLSYGIVACNSSSVLSCDTTGVACSRGKLITFSLVGGEGTISRVRLSMANSRGISGTLTSVTATRLLRVPVRAVGGKVLSFDKASHHFRCGKAFGNMAIISSCTRRPARVTTALGTTRRCPRGRM